MRTLALASLFAAFLLHTVTAVFFCFIATFCFLFTTAFFGHVRLTAAFFCACFGAFSTFIATFIVLHTHMLVKRALSVMIAARR